MPHTETGETHSRTTLPRREHRVAPVAGLVGAVLVIVVWRVLGLPYLRETAGGMMFLFMTGVSAYRDGRIKAHPLGSLSFIGFFTILGIAIGHIPT